MQYFGGKQRIVKDIVPVLKEYIKNKDMKFIDAFCGSSKVSIEMVKTIPEINIEAYDLNNYLINMFNGLKKGWIPPSLITKEEYTKIKSNKDTNKALTGFVGFGCSFAGKWFGGYAKNNSGRNYAETAQRSLINDVKFIKNINYEAKNFFNLISNDNLIYCDPPYKGTTAYGFVGNFDNNKFWNKVRELSLNNIVIVSEYEAPADFECIWRKKVKLDIRNKSNLKEERVEKLFILKGCSL